MWSEVSMMVASTLSYALGRMEWEARVLRETAIIAVSPSFYCQ